MNLSFWEADTWFSEIDFLIIGSGITGLNAALHLRKKYEKAKILIFEKGMLPEGASTKNAGFACFGSVSEILEDLKNQPEEDVVALVKRRVQGLELLRQNLGDKVIDFQSYGGYELFTEEDTLLYEECLDSLGKINKTLFPVFNAEVFSVKQNSFRFKRIQPQLVYSKFEGQIDTGKMMSALVKKVQSEGIRILNNVEVKTFQNNENDVEVITENFRIKTKKLLIATNGFASRLNIPEVKPARAQVLITQPIQNLPFKGTFHLDKGYYYFRNIGKRVLFGGGRNLDFKTEETDKNGLTELIQNKLNELLKTTILPTTAFEIERSWSGIMGVGQTKDPIVKELSPNVYCGVRLGGMGIAIGSKVGQELAELATT
ncbi:FAD-dependent oxidoreductase [Gramella sp. AN32]|uniref:NAD(P)/FAD-dependent oxidoreductase n=1 Tax=Christiangramia antarctica TaxID=2058158 RepID=A0ABW5X345_9FLAO|nr:FAD-dependent oxidoreductase [Gramella sp. AN32]MCM4154953.1 FAD-dependent oxidoreductase [Gramella sp. AN32]